MTRAALAGFLSFAAAGTVLIASVTWGCRGAGPAAPPRRVAVTRFTPDVLWRWPLEGRPTLVKGFDPPAAPWLPGHRGVDLATTPSALVVASGPGVVHFAGNVAGRGTISIDHGSGLLTTYEPVNPTVSVGTLVAGGRPIGHVAAGHHGCSTAACLHWGLRFRQGYLNPLSLLAVAPVRLYPVDSHAAGALAPRVRSRPGMRLVVDRAYAPL